MIVLYSGSIAYGLILIFLQWKLNINIVEDFNCWTSIGFNMGLHQEGNERLS